MTARIAGALALALLAGCGNKHLYPDGRGLQGQLEREVIALTQRVRLLEHQAATCSDGSTDPLYNELFQIARDLELDLDRVGSATVVTIPMDHLFSPGTDRVRLEADKTLDLLSMVLRSHPHHAVLVQAHTDGNGVHRELRGAYANEWDLGYGRARAVVQKMAYDFSVPERRFTIASRAFHDPIASGDTPAGEARNRRIVLYITPPRAR